MRRGCYHVAFSSLLLATRALLSAFQSTGWLWLQSPVTLPMQAQQHVLMGANSVLAPVGFLSAKMLAQLRCFPVLLRIFIASQA